MELIATTRPEPVAFAYGAYLHNGGTHLRCGLLFVQRDHPAEVITLECPTTKKRIRVRLPKEAVNAVRNARFSRETLEVVP